jgi:RNA polymerase sigma-70 factor (ECF subfamily)
MTLSDVQRVELRQAGDAEVTFQMDEDTFRVLYDRTARGLLSYLTRVTGDRTLADDLLQETYYRFLRASGTYENDAHRRNALFRIATNLARDAHRRRRLRPWMATQESDLTWIADRGDPAGRLEQRRDLDRALARLKPRDRAMLWLAYAEGSSHREIAAAVGVQLGSVRLLLFRARRKLAGLLR